MYAIAAQVTFVDFGNKETVQGAAVRAISPELSALAPQAQMLQLANLKVPFLLAQQHNPEAGVRAGSV
jgi:Tudor domain